MENARVLSKPDIEERIGEPIFIVFNSIDGELRGFWAICDLWCGELRHNNRELVRFDGHYVAFKMKNYNNNWFACDKKPRSFIKRGTKLVYERGYPKSENCQIVGFD